MDVGERYLELTLRFKRLCPDLVCSYAGPGELAARVAAEPAPRAADLRDQSRDLQSAVDGVADDARRRWLGAQLQGLETACRALAGEPLSYRELVERCYGVRPALVPEDAFAAAHALLADALPETGRLSERYERWLATQDLPADRALEVVRALAGELRDHVRRAFGLPDGECVDIEIVRGKRWAAFADYRGALRTKIEINADLPLHAWRLVELAAHEIYPGHHTEHVCKEIELVRRRGQLEHAVFAYPTPQALVAEGIAMIALECVLGEDAHRAAAARLRPLGVHYDAETAVVVRRAEEALLGVRPNLAMLLDEHGASVDELRAYARRWMLRPAAVADKAVDNVVRRPWRPYEACYTEGLRLCRAFAAREPDGFRRLLTEPITTADLIAG